MARVNSCAGVLSLADCTVQAAFRLFAFLWVAVCTVHCRNVPFLGAGEIGRLLNAVRRNSGILRSAFALTVQILAFFNTHSLYFHSVSHPDHPLCTKTCLSPAMHLEVKSSKVYLAH